MTESKVLKGSMLNLSASGGLAWRNNLGVAVYKNKKTGKESRVPYGIGHKEGGSDIVFCMPLKIRPEHIGTTIGVFGVCECKATRGTVRDKQMNFLTQVAARGGIAMLTRDPTDITLLNVLIKDGAKVWGMVHGKLPERMEEMFIKESPVPKPDTPGNRTKTGPYKCTGCGCSMPDEPNNPYGFCRVCEFRSW